MTKKTTPLKLKDVSNVKSSFIDIDDLIYKSKVVLKESKVQNTGFVNAILCLAEEIKELKDENIQS